MVLNKAAVVAIRRLARTRAMSQVEIAQLFGVTQPHISAIMRGITSHELTEDEVREEQALKELRDAALAAARESLQGADDLKRRILEAQAKQLRALGIVKD